LPFKKSRILETNGTKELHTVVQDHQASVSPFPNLSRREDRKRDAAIEELVRQVKKREENDKKTRWFRRRIIFCINEEGGQPP